MRAYELMVILDTDLEDATVETAVTRISGQIEAEGARIASTERWGKRKFAYEINHKSDGYYVVFEVVSEGAGFPELERTLRIADEVVRHKLVRLPDTEAVRRGLLTEASPA